MNPPADSSLNRECITDYRHKVVSSRFLKIATNYAMAFG